MLSPSQEREHQRHVDDVLDYMRRLKVSPTDLISFGGEDLSLSDPARCGKARAVERTWALMASLGVRHSDLAPEGVTNPGFLVPRPRHRKSNLKQQQNQRVDPLGTGNTNTSNINELAVSVDFGGSQITGNDVDPEASAEKMKARFAALDK